MVFPFAASGYDGSEMCAAPLSPFLVFDDAPAMSTAYAQPTSSQIISSDVAELCVLMVLHLWSRIPLRDLLLAWSSSALTLSQPPLPLSQPIPLPPSTASNAAASYLPSPASTASSSLASQPSCPPLSTTTTTTTTSTAALADIVLESRLYVEHVLSTTKVSSSVIVLALKYLQRICTRKDAIRAASPLVTTKTNYKLAFLVSLVLANKFADDERFTNAAWASVADYSVETLNRAEFDALDAIEFKLTVGETEYTKWLETVDSFATKTQAVSEHIERRRQEEARQLAARQLQLQQEEQQLLEHFQQLQLQQQRQQQQQQQQVQNFQYLSPPVQRRQSLIPPVVLSNQYAQPSASSYVFYAPRGSYPDDASLASGHVWPEGQMVIGH
ncbi:hypothetical protein BDZ88DRAFT_406470 [Geranomyces variabilis]|nr:hypothetical protein BDZ88DRAFT_406470 [Geranomyces variabilis]KAJ3139607.1 hypothetical protein HDU90_009108 [Geranomyces variabilis]